MNKKYILLATLAALLVFISSMACAEPAPSPDIRDDSGAAVNIEQPVQRIISLAPSNTEIVYALGLEDRLVGVTEYCDYPPAAKNKPKIGGFSTVDMERVVALQPDLVLATDIHSKTVTPLLQKVGFNVVTLYPATLNGLIRDINLVGKITGSVNTASDLTAGLNKRIQAVASAAGDPSTARPLRTLLIIWYDPLMVAGAGTLPDDMIKVAGGNNIAADVTGYPSIGLETIISRDPEVIIVPSDMGQPDNPLWNFVVTDPRLKNTTAARNNAIYKMDGNLALRAGPRCIDALEQMASFYHPATEPKKQRPVTN
ncbi:MAG: cobalamin-binding protein [Dehalococcoidia bacterium]